MRGQAVLSTRDAGEGVCAVQMLRAATHADHAAVDERFGRFDLGAREGYADFLTAHARILPLAERLLRPAEVLPHWQGRTAPLLADLSDLGRAVPAETDMILPFGTAARWGALYVLEGSRLGGAILGRQVPEGMPTRFLDAVHPQGAWRTFMDALNAADSGAAWQAEAVAGARVLFAGYCVAGV